MSKDKKYEAYLHINGTLQVKRMPFGESTIDTTAPYVDKYLGECVAENIEEARNLFSSILAYPNG